MRVLLACTLTGLYCGVSNVSPVKIVKINETRCHAVLVRDIDNGIDNTVHELQHSRRCVPLRRIDASS